MQMIKTLKSHENRRFHGFFITVSILTFLRSYDIKNLRNRVIGEVRYGDL